MIRMTEGLKMTDSLYELRKFVLIDLINRGYEYIAKDKDGNLCAYSRPPVKKGCVWDFDKASNTDKMEDISVVSRIFPDIEWENVEPYRIPCINKL